LSATHLNTASIKYKLSDTSSSTKSYNLKTHLFLTAGKSFQLNENLIFAPTILAKIVGKQYGADLNLNFFLYKKLWLGAFYKYGYGPGGLIQYYVTNKFRVAYSYDSGLGNQTKLGSSHEVMIGFDFSGKANKSQMINPRFL
jgi:type IX secretion system PorP/SprF family membrane protein